MPISSEEKIRIGDCEFPRPFSNGLEFNAPAHGTWNIVHVAFSIPGAHQIYICADNCLRGVVMTAAEMGELSRFSSVVLEEDDMIHSGRLEQTTIEGVTEVLKGLDKVPEVAVIFPVCVHRFMGCDISYIYHALEERFPDTRFVRGFMDPVMQKRGTTPDQRLRKAMMDIIPERNEDEGIISFVGSDMPASSNDIRLLFEKKGIRVMDSAHTSSLEEYDSMASSTAFICQYPAGKMGSEALAKRLGRKLFYMPMSFDADRIVKDLEELGLDHEDELIRDIRKKIASSLAELKEMTEDIPVAIDYTAHPRPLSLARFLLTNGIFVKTVYLDSCDPDEEEDFLFLKENYPDLMLHSTVHVSDRRPVRPEGKVLAIGQKAAWFEGTEYFVNIVEGAGLWGFSGIYGFLSFMKESLQEKKDLRDIIPRKGLGCISCYE